MATGDLRYFAADDSLAMMIGECEWPKGATKLVNYENKRIAWIVYRSKTFTRDAVRDIGKRVAADIFDPADVAQPGEVNAEYAWRVWRVVRAEIVK
jgi:hypothetical protein